MNQYEIDFKQGYDRADEDWIDRIKQAREDIDDLYRYYDESYVTGNNDPMFKCEEVFEILDRLITESED